MARFADTVSDESTGAPIEGVSVFVFQYADESLASLVDESDTPIPNPVLTDEFGNFEFYAEDGFYAIEYRYGGRKRFRREVVTVGEVPVSDELTAIIEPIIAEATADATGAAEGYRDEALASKVSAAASAVSADASETQAGLYAAAAEAFAGGLYADTTAGLAGTASGDYFLVKGSGNTFATLYKDNAGVAEDQGLAIPSLAALLSLVEEAKRDRAARYGIAIGTAAAMYDLRYWRDILFQDAACTTPVTAAGDLVGGVRNMFGDTDWDLIISDNSKRPTFDIIDGIPQIVCADGKGLYSRANVTLSFPCLMLAGLNLTSTQQAGYFGFVKNTGEQFFLTRGTLDDAAATDGQLGVYATGPTHAAPRGTMNVLHALIEGSRLNFLQGSMDLMTGAFNGDVASQYDDGDTISGMSFGLNIGSQSLGIGVPNSNRSCTFFGGCVVMGGEYDRAALSEYFEAQMRPEIRSGDTVYLYDGDSTGDDILTTTNTVDGEFFGTWAEEVDTANHPNDTIYYCNFNAIGQRHSGFRLLQEGSSGGRRFHVNNSVSGSEPSYSLAAREELMFPAWLDHIDVRITNHGYNLAGSSDFRGHFIESENRYRLRWPDTPAIFIQQAPVLANNSIAFQNAQAAAVAALFGDVHLIDIYSHYIAEGKPSGWYQDGLHRTALGVEEGDRPPFDLGMAAFAPPAEVAPRLLGLTDTAINTNPRLEWDGATLTGWTHSGTGTASRSTEQYDSELGALSSTRIRQTGSATHRYQTGSAVAYRSGTLALLVREFSKSPFNDGDATNDDDAGLGEVRLIVNGTNGPAVINNHSRRAYGKFRDRILLADVPADATTWEIRLYGSSSAENATAYYSQAVLVAGTMPKRLR